MNSVEIVTPFSVILLKNIMYSFCLREKYHISYLFKKTGTFTQINELFYWYINY